MKPLAVLLLVVAAVGGLLFAVLKLGGDDTSTNPPPIELAPEDPGDTNPDSGPGTLPVGNDGTRAGIEVPADPGTTRTAEVGEEVYENVLTGMVVNAEQKPLAGAKVTLTRAGAMIFQNDPQDRTKDIHTTTDSEGRFTFGNIEPHEHYALEAAAKGYSRGEETGVAVGVAGTFLQPPIVLTTGAKLVGSVTDVGGAIVPGAVLHLDSMFARPGEGANPGRLSAVSDASGNYEILNVPPGNRALSVEAEGYANFFDNGIVFRGNDGKPIERNVKLEVAEQIHGRVVSKSNVPIADANVKAISYSNSNRQCREDVKSNERGEFTFERLAAGQYTIAVNAQGYRAGHETRVKTGEAGLVIELVEQATISGRVIAADTNQPVPKYKVVVRQTFPQQTVPSSKVGKEVAFTEEDGSFVLDSVPPGTYLVQGTAPGYAPSFSDSFRIVEGDTVKGVVVRLTKGGRIKGTIIGSDGKPVRRPQVSTHDNIWANSLFDQALGEQYPTNATQKSVMGDGQGRFNIGGLKGETYQVRVKAQGYTEYIKQDIQVLEGQATDLGEIELQVGGTISGQVLDLAGSSVPGSRVNLRPDGRPDGLPRNYQAKSGADGKYVLPNVYPGAYILTAGRSGGGGDFLDNLQGEESSSVKLVIGDGQELHFELKISN